MLFYEAGFTNATVVDDAIRFVSSNYNNKRKMENQQRQQTKYSNFEEN